MSADIDDNILEVSQLRVTFQQEHELTLAVDNVSFSLRKKQALGIVGESGSGKSVTSLSILNLLSGHTSNQTQGSILFDDNGDKIDLLSIEDKALYKIRGLRISMVFQEPMSSLNPVRKCGDQVKEVLDVHDIGLKNQRKNVVLDLYRQVSLPDVDRVYNSYPHELSGGQLQRVNIAMALAAKPDIIICDEPTTALDVTVQSQIIALLKDIVASQDISLIFITHDLDVVADICDSVIVMYQGKIVEEGLLPDLFLSPKHAYTQALLTCKPSKENRGMILPTVDQIVQKTYVPTQRVKHELDGAEDIIEVTDLSVHFPVKKTSFFGPRSHVKAVDQVSFSLRFREILGIVGESGSGKSTVANCIAGLIDPTAGQITYRGKDISPFILSKNRDLRTKIQLVFQDPYSSLNPKMSIGAAIKEPLRFHSIVPKDQLDMEVARLMDQVGLDASFVGRYPHQLSGGQRQRVCIARALSIRPELLICDESVSALDVSVQAQILNLLDDLRSKLDVSILFISHDLSVIHYLCDRVLVMKEGQVVERGTADQIMDDPQDPYTQRLINSLPKGII